MQVGHGSVPFEAGSYTCGVCGKVAEYTSEEEQEALQEEWWPGVWDGEKELDYVCPDHEVRETENGHDGYELDAIG